MKAHKIGNIQVYLNGSSPQDSRSVLILLKKDGEWLMGYNSVRKGWELPGGHIEAGEDVFQAAKRECFEEVGAVIENIVPRGYYLLPDGHKTAFVLADVVSMKSTPLEHEISEVKSFKDFPSDVTFKDGLYSFIAELIASEDINNESDYTVSSKQKWEDVWKNSEADRYGDAAIRQKVSSKKIQLLADLGINFKEEERVLESGCGDATLVLSLADRFNVNAYGVDFSEAALKRANDNSRAFGTYLRLEQADARNTPYEDNTFDKVISLGIIEHFKSPEVALSELFRVTKPEGNLILMTPNRNSFGPWDRRIQQATGKWPFGYQTEYTPGDLKNLAENAGFVTCVSKSSQRPWFYKDKANMQVVSLLDKAASLIMPDRGFYSWYVGMKP